MHRITPLSHRFNTDREEPLLSLGEAADRLGVHPTTLRRWAKSGDVVFVVTPGGHRRFPVSEIRRLSQRSKRTSGTGELRMQLEQQAMMHTRSALSNQHDAAWISQMDNDAREQQRELGRRVLGLLMQFVVADDDGADLLQEAHEVGRIYADIAREAGLTLGQTLRALMFFRDNIVESVVIKPDSIRSRPDASRRLLRRANQFLNEIMFGVTEKQEKLGRNGVLQA